MGGAPGEHFSVIVSPSLAFSDVALASQVVGVPAAAEDGGAEGEELSGRHLYGRHPRCCSDWPVLSNRCRAQLWLAGSQGNRQSSGVPDLIGPMMSRRWIAFYLRRLKIRGWPRVYQPGTREETICGLR